MPKKLRTYGSGHQVQLQRRRRLRREANQAEHLLWECLRARRLDGLKFRRQHPVGRYIVDFCCVERKLVVELDGYTHENRFQGERDFERQNGLEAAGWRVIRFENERVYSDLTGVLKAIYWVATGERLSWEGQE